MASKIPFIDRLRERGIIDQWGFMAFAVMGFAGIFSAKWFEIPTGWVAITSVFVMLAYAGIVGRPGTGRVGADQAGDNCYYLGLIYTLASLSFAIATFNPDDAASTIVQGFGIALATTIFGLILRVFFSQGRPDLENVEEQTRLELTEAATKLKSELSAVARSMNDLSRQLQQSAQEVHSSALSGIEQFTSSSVDGLKIVVATASEAIRSEANDFAARSKRYGTTFDRLLEKLDQHAASVGQLTEAQNGLALTAGAAKEAAEYAAASAQSLSASVQASEGVTASAEIAARSAKEATEALGSSVSVIRDQFEAIRVETDRQLELLRQAPTEAIGNVVTLLTSAGQQLQSQLAEVARTHSETHRMLTAQGEAALATSRAHNEALSGELDRSRELATKVHSSFVDMTGKLASAMEGSA